VSQDWFDSCKPDDHDERRDRVRTTRVVLDFASRPAMTDEQVKARLQAAGFHNGPGPYLACGTLADFRRLLGADVPSCSFTTTSPRDCGACGWRLPDRFAGYVGGCPACMLAECDDLFVTEFLQLRDGVSTFVRRSPSDWPAWADAVNPAKAAAPSKPRETTAQLYPWLDLAVRAAMAHVREAHPQVADLLDMQAQIIARLDREQGP